MQVRYMGRRRPITEARYKVYSTLHKRVNKTTNKRERLYSATVKFVAAVCVMYVVCDFILSQNGF